MEEITDATSKLLSSLIHGTLWFKTEAKLKRKISNLRIHAIFEKF